MASHLYLLRVKGGSVSHSRWHQYIMEKNANLSDKRECYSIFFFFKSNPEPYPKYFPSYMSNNPSSVSVQYIFLKYIFKLSKYNNNATYTNISQQVPQIFPSPIYVKWFISHHITSLKSKLLFKNLFNMKAKGKSNLPTLALDYNDIVGINASIPTIKPLDCCISNCMTVHSNWARIVFSYKLLMSDLW